MITFEELNPKRHPIPNELITNLAQLYGAINVVRMYYNSPMLVTSGYRTKIEQMRVNPAVTGSAHSTFQAVDIYDRDGKLWDWCIENLESYIIPCGLYLEEKMFTPKHVHFQTRRPNSGNRIFKP